MKLYSFHSETKELFLWAGSSAVIFGSVEGLTLHLCRFIPPILGPKPVSQEIIWVAPLLNLFLFLGLASGLLMGRRIAPGRFFLFDRLHPSILFPFLGLFGAVAASRVVHPAGAAILSLGVIITLRRKFFSSGHEFPLFLKRATSGVSCLLIFAWMSMVILDGGIQEYREGRLREAKSDSANVLILMMDTVRMDTFTSLLPSMPELRDLVSQGTVFENAWATSSWSLPSQASILTGEYPNRHGSIWPDLTIHEDTITLPEYFERLGYITAAFSGNSSWVTPEYVGRGFSRFQVYTLEDLARRTFYGRILDRLSWELGYHYAGRGKKADRINREFLDFVDEFPSRPFFAYLCYMDANRTFHEKRLNHPFWQQSPSPSDVFAAYQHGIQELGKQITQLLEALEKRELLNNTLVVLTSDHGESFANFKQGDHHPGGHGTSLYPEQVKVPLVLFFPGKITTGHISTAVSVSQIPSTVVEQLDIGHSPFEEKSLFRGTTVPHSVGRQRENDPIRAMLRYGGVEVESLIWRQLLYICEARETALNEEVYDLESDPTATSNLLFLPSLQPQIDSLRARRLFHQKVERARVSE